METPEDQAVELVARWRKIGKERPPRRHHYVPRFYLERFADGEGSIAMVSRSGRGVIRTSPVNAAVETDYNAIVTEEGETSYEVEGMLSWIEEKAAPAIDRMVASGIPPSPEDHEALVVFMAFQLTRGPSLRKAMNKLGDFAARLMLQSLPKDRDGISRVLAEAGAEPTEEAIDQTLEMITNLDQYEFEPHQNESIRVMLTAGAEIMLHLTGMTWSMLRFEDDLLVTSDQPVTLWAKPSPERQFYGIGVATADEIRLPLDPRHMLVLTPEPPSFDLRLNSRWALEVNKTTIHSCQEWVYAHPSHPGLSDIGAEIGAHPAPGIEIDWPGATASD